MAELSVPQVDFSILGNLGKTYNDSRQEAVRQRALSQLGQGDKIDPRVLLASGDMSLANLGVQIQNRQQDQERQSRLDQRQTSRDAVDDRFREESLRLQKAAAARANEDKPLIKEVTDPNTGSTSFVRINPRTGELSPLGSPMPASQPNNPYATSGPKLNADQSKAATMTDRMSDANTVITKNENINDGLLAKPLGIAQAIPYVRDSALFNAVASPERQQVVQAQRNFVNAILRVESGAAVSESEFNNAQKQYFPQVGDSKEVLEQKRQNRVTAMQGMARQAGPGYKPPAALTSQQPTAAQPPAAPPPPQPGQLVQGYRFKGGNPADPNSWVQAQ